MTGANVRLPPPLTRLNPWYPGQFGVPGTDSETGLRLNCTGTIFYVDPNYPGASDLRDGTNPTDPMRTVQGALNRCQGYRGDVVLVMANNNWIWDNAGSAAIGYNTALSESVTMSVPGVSLVGVNLAGVTGVPWINPQAATTCIEVTACNCLIEGFNFQGTPPDAGPAVGIAIDASYIGAYGDNVTIRNCMFLTNFAQAIRLRYSYFCDIHHNMFFACSDYGIANDDAQFAAQFAQIHHNWFFNVVTTAVYIGEGEYWHIYENSFWNDDAASGAAATDEGVQVTTGDYNFVHNNAFSCLLPVPANGDWNDLNTAGTNDIWAQNYCNDGPNVANPL